MSILKIKNENGEWISVPAIKSENGKDGYSPVKGTDYWNEEDKQEIETYCENYIDEKITQAIGGEY